MKLLVVEDSQKLQKSLKAGLRQLGYAVDIASDGEEALRFALSYDYDVIVLDLMLPKKSGLEVLREIRQSSRTPEILILSARDQTQDRVLGLEQGADDYLTKPFAFDELHARIQALIRRKFRQKSPIMQIDKIRIDTSMHLAYYDAHCFAFTPTEMGILEYLAFNRGKVISAEKLQAQVYNSDSYSSKNSLEVHISSIRKKIRAAGIDNPIKTQRGFGYYIANLEPA